MRRFLKLFSPLVLVLLCSGCDMRGDTKKTSGFDHQNGPTAETFACGTKSCYSGTQYCLQMEDTGNGSAGSNCQDYPTGCQERSCLEQDARTQQADPCSKTITYKQSDSKITVLCHR